MRLRLRWDVISHPARSDCSASAMSQLLLYEPIRMARKVACSLKGSTSTRSLSYPRGDTHVIDSITAFDDPLQRIRTGQIARVPILIGNMQDDGTVFTYNTSESLATFLSATRFASAAGSVTPDVVRALYPGLSDPQVIAAAEGDIQFRWCVHF